MSEVCKPQEGCRAVRSLPALLASLRTEHAANQLQELVWSEILF